MNSGKYFVRVVEYPDIVSTTAQDQRGERMNYGTMAERVARGIEWLTEVAPGWRDKIDLDYLDLADYRYCVIAQVSENDFTEGWELLNGGMGSDYRERHTMLGFDISVDEFREACDTYYGELTDAWSEALSV